MLDSGTRRFTTRRLDRGHSKGHRIQSGDCPSAFRKYQRGVHIERELAHAFYMRRIILPFRLAETLPRREILFYLGDVPWFNASNPPTEEHLEALTARVKGLMPDSAAAGKAVPPQNEGKKAASVKPCLFVVRRLRSFSLQNSWNLEMGRDHNIPLRGGVIFVVCPPADEQNGRHWRRATAGLWTVVSALLRLHRLRMRQTAWSQNKPPPLRVSARGRLQTAAPRLWFRDLRIRPEYAGRSVSQCDFFTAARRYPRGADLGDRLRSLARVTCRPSPTGFHIKSHMTIIHNFRELR